MALSCNNRTINSATNVQTRTGQLPQGDLQKEIGQSIPMLSTGIPHTHTQIPGCAVSIPAPYPQIQHPASESSLCLQFDRYSTWDRFESFVYHLLNVAEFAKVLFRGTPVGEAVDGARLSAGGRSMMSEYRQGPVLLDSCNRIKHAARPLFAAERTSTVGCNRDIVDMHYRCPGAQG
eukprot:gb/GECG01002335.1/.p1 GENE.gb/GECG01002335.1/~~gb/GECG01002335.1/.p1  ORF type:complete len:177 (+),score=8.25 gb/GECG01002335.1/:1-531(+)